MIKKTGISFMKICVSREEKKTHIRTMFPSIPTAVGFEWRNICRRQQSTSGPCENWPGRLNLKVITIRDRMTGCIVFVWFELYSISASQFIRVWAGWFTTKCHVSNMMLPIKWTVLVIVSTNDIFSIYRFISKAIR